MSKADPGTPRKVEIEVLQNRGGAFVLRMNGARVAGEFDIGCWDVLATWTVDADEIVTACADEVEL